MHGAGLDPEGQAHLAVHVPTQERVHLLRERPPAGPIPARDRDRMKYLFREILGVDVDDVVRKVVATIAVERAKQALENTKDWKRYMEAEGGIVILPSNVTQLGRRDPKK